METYPRTSPKVQQKAARYYMHSNKLIRRSYSGPHLTCIRYPQTLEVLCQIHDGECGNHSGGRSLTQKALNVGYFWPTMRHDSAEYVKKCDRCQRYKPIPNLPAEVYHPGSRPKLYPLLKKPMWSDSSGETSSADLAAHSHWSLTMAHRRQDSHTIAHKERPKGDAGRRLKASVWRRSPLKKRLHASCGKYPGSYPFPKGGRIVTQLPISSVLWET
ncbi:unnamed protein product [Prunus brigantina]